MLTGLEIVPGAKNRHMKDIRVVQMYNVDKAFFHISSNSFEEFHIPSNFRCKMSLFLHRAHMNKLVNDKFLSITQLVYNFKIFYY